MLYKDYSAKLSSTLDKYRNIIGEFTTRQIEHFKIKMHKFTIPEVQQKRISIKFYETIDKGISHKVKKVLSTEIPLHLGILSATFQIAAYDTESVIEEIEVEYPDAIWWASIRYYSWVQIQQKMKKKSISAIMVEQLFWKYYPKYAIIWGIVSFVFAFGIYKINHWPLFIDLMGGKPIFPDAIVLAIGLAFTFFTMMITAREQTYNRIIKSARTTRDQFTDFVLKRKYKGEELKFIIPHEEPINFEKIDKYDPEKQVLGTTVSHTMVIGATGTGKTTTIFEPVVLDRAMRRLPVWLFDPKRGMFPLYALFDKVYFIDLSTNIGSPIDPFDVVRMAESQGITIKEQFIKELAETLTMPIQSSEDKMWENSVKEQLLIPMLNTLYDKNFPFGYLSVLYELIKENPNVAEAVFSYDPNKANNDFYLVFTNPGTEIAQHKTRQSKVSVAEVIMSMVSDKRFMSLFASNKIPYEEFIKPGNLIVVTWVPSSSSNTGEKGADLSQLLMNIVYRHLNLIANVRYQLAETLAKQHGKRRDDFLPTITMIMDELLQFGRIASLEGDSRILRSSKIQMVFGIQDMSGFKNLYKENAASIVGNTARKVILPDIADKETIELLSGLDIKMPELSLSLSEGRVTTSTKETQIDMKGILRDKVANDPYNNYFEAFVIERIPAKEGVIAYTIAETQRIDQIRKALAPIAEKSVFIPRRPTITLKKRQQIKQDILTAIG